MVSTGLLVIAHKSLADLLPKAPVNVNYHDLELPAYIMGAVVAGGGIMGYAKSRSVPSIVAGCTVGLLCKYRGCTAHFSNWAPEEGANGYL
jgi:hypothetical protein